MKKRSPTKAKKKSKVAAAAPETELRRSPFREKPPVVPAADQKRMAKEILKREKELLAHMEGIEEKKRALSDAIEPFFKKVSRGFTDAETGRTVYFGSYQGLYFLKQPAQPKVPSIGG